MNDRFPSHILPPDLVITKCIPDCAVCCRIWLNTTLNHRIICRCKLCNHGSEIFKNDKSFHLKVKNSNSDNLEVFKNKVAIFDDDQHYGA